MRLRSVADDEDELQTGDEAGLAEGGDVTGQMLIEAASIDPEIVETIEQRRRETGESMSEAAVALGVIDEDEITRIIERQLHFHVLAPDDDRIDPLVVAAFHPTDPLAQAARRLRSTISATTREDGEPLRIVMVLAVDTRAEAALVAANLAVACAQTGYRTLLVDANLDAPVQHDLFRVSNRSGLSVLLAQGIPVDTIQPTAINRLSVMPAGPSVRNYVELLDRAKLYARLRDVSDGFDLVLVDASMEDSATAVAAVDGADASMVVVRRDDSSLARLKDLIEQLEARGAPVLGTVMTS